MPGSEYSFVLAKRLGEDGYAALADMAADREEQLTATLDRQFSSLRQELDRRFAGVDGKLVALDHRIDLQTERTERRIVEQCGQLREGIGCLRTEMVQQRADLLKWAMLFWISQAAAVAGIVGVMR